MNKMLDFSSEYKKCGPALPPDHLFPLLLLGVCNGASHNHIVEMFSGNAL